MEYYNGSLLFGDLSSSFSCFKTCAVCIVNVTTQTCLEYTNLLPKMAQDKNVVQHSLRIAIATFSVMRCANEGRYVSVSTVSEDEKLRKKRENNIELY